MEGTPVNAMTSFDKRIAVMNRLLEEMACLGRRLDDIQDRAEEKEQVLAKLKSENRRYRSVFETSSQRFFLKDETLCYLTCSRGFASDFNKSPDEIIGKYEDQLVPLEVARIKTEREKRILESGQTDESLEIHNVRGQERAFITLRAPIINEENGDSISGVFGVTVDISVYLHRVWELENINRQQAELLAGQSQQLARLQGNIEYVIAEKRHQEELFQNFRAHVAGQLSLRDQEIEQLRSDLKSTPEAHSEKIRAYQATFSQLQNAVHDVRQCLDLLAEM